MNRSVGDTGRPEHKAHPAASVDREPKLCLHPSVVRCRCLRFVSRWYYIRMKNAIGDRYLYKYGREPIK